MRIEEKGMGDTGNGSDAVRGMRELLLASGYAEKAIDYFLRQPNMGSMQDADHKTELTGPCGDTMRCYLKVDGDRIQDAKYEVLGCPGAISAAMALVEIVRGRTLDEALTVKDRDVFRELVEIPDQKQHCIRLAVKTLEKAIREYQGVRQDQPDKGEEKCLCSNSSACNAAR